MFNYDYCHYDDYDYSLLQDDCYSSFEDKYGMLELKGTHTCECCGYDDNNCSAHCVIDDDVSINCEVVLCTSCKHDIENSVNNNEHDCMLDIAIDKLKQAV